MQPSILKEKERIDVDLRLSGQLNSKIDLKDGNLSMFLDVSTHGWLEISTKADDHCSSGLDLPCPDV